MAGMSDGELTLDQIRERREALLTRLRSSRVNWTFEQFATEADAYALTGDEYNAVATIRGLDFLAGNEVSARDPS
jgi:hypothetical protein